MRDDEPEDGREGKGTENCTVTSSRADEKADTGASCSPLLSLLELYGDAGAKKGLDSFVRSRESLRSRFWSRVTVIVRMLNVLHSVAHSSLDCRE